MAGRGPAPKDPSRRARKNKDTTQVHHIPLVKCPQPALPEDIPWPDRTVEFWAKWARSPLAELFTEVDWEELMAAAMLHADFWSGNLDRAPELRIRMASFGASLEARSRLRIFMAEADQAEAAAKAGHPSSQDVEEEIVPDGRYASVTPLRAVD